MVELNRLHHVLVAAEARIDWAVAVRRVYAADDAKSARVWIACKTREPKAVVGSRLRLAAAVEEMSLTAEAWAAGEISVEHVCRLVDVCNPRTKELFARDEHLLVHHARTLTFDAFEQCVARWLLHADPDGSDHTEMQRRHRRRVSLDQTLSGMFSGHMLFDPISGTIVSDELRRREQVLFEADWAEAKQRLGREPLLHELARTPDQRRADAMVDMAIRSATAPNHGRRPAPLFTVVFGAERFTHLCQLASGRTVSPEALMAWMDDAQLEAIVFESSGVRAIKVSRQRQFTGVVRRILDVRDQQCTAAYCDEPPSRCQGDHITPTPPAGSPHKTTAASPAATTTAPTTTATNKPPTPTSRTDGDDPV